MWNGRGLPRVTAGCLPPCFPQPPRTCAGPAPSQRFCCWARASAAPSCLCRRRGQSAGRRMERAIAAAAAVLRRRLQGPCHPTSPGAAPARRPVLALCSRGSTTDVCSRAEGLWKWKAARQLAKQHRRSCRGRQAPGFSASTATSAPWRRHRPARVGGSRGSPHRNRGSPHGWAAAAAERGAAAAGRRPDRLHAAGQRPTNAPTLALLPAMAASTTAFAFAICSGEELADQTMPIRWARGWQWCSKAY